MQRWCIEIKEGDTTPPAPRQQPAPARQQVQKAPKAERRMPIVQIGFDFMNAVQQRGRE
jgi:hypothetical protein